MESYVSTSTPLEAQVVDLPLRLMQGGGIEGTAPSGPETSVRHSTTVKSVHLDSSTSAAVKSQTTVHGTRKLLRRDSLDRREAVLRGKEGSRARRRWENDRLLNNPHAEPPLPSDWEIRPTYPRRTIPYYLAPLWDAAEFQRAIESKLDNKRRLRRRHHGKNGSISSSQAFNAGISPMEEAASTIPKEIRARLKHARSAKGLLQDLEEDVRSFVRCWNDHEIKLREDGLGDAPLPMAKSLAFRSKDQSDNVGVKGRAVYARESAVVDDEDEEIVFVGRNGAMLDMLSSSPPDRRRSNHEHSRHDHVEARDETDDECGELDYAPSRQPQILATEKLVFQALESDRGAAFARWLVHCVGNYYGLRTWSVTRDVDGQVHREAYVGIDERARGFMRLGRCVDLAGRKDVELPKPLWGMV